MKRVFLYCPVHGKVVRYLDNDGKIEGNETCVIVTGAICPIHGETNNFYAIHYEGLDSQGYAYHYGCREQSPVVRCGMPLTKEATDPPSVIASQKEMYPGQWEQERMTEILGDYIDRVIYKLNNWRPPDEKPTE